MTLKAIVIDTKDNVANLIGPGEKGQQVVCEVAHQAQVTIELIESIPPNHKCAFVDIKKGDAIIKYGQDIGRASKDIKKGQYIHVHNIESNRGRGDLAASH